MSPFWNRFSRKPSTRLARTRQKLDKLVHAKGASSEISGETWACYARALELAVECGRDTVVALVNDVDPTFPAGPAPAELQVPAAIRLLLSSEPAPEPVLEAALRLAHRKGEVAQIRYVEHRMCLSLAHRGETDRLVWKLLDRRKHGLLDKHDLEGIVQAYLDARSIEVSSPWVSFFEQLAQDQLPHIHQVHALLGRYPEAAGIAEERGDFRAALRYLLESPGLDAARRAITLNDERVHDPESAILAHRHAAEELWRQENYLSAAEHFQKARDRERSSDCYLNAGQIADAIKSRPLVSPDWLAMVREKTDNTVRHLVQAADSLAAIRLLHNAVDSLRTKGSEDFIDREAARLQGILHSMVRTARASLAEEARNAPPGAEVFRRWSAIEEAAGNFLEAGIQAELGHDYLTAALMFEKAGAYGQALRAFEQSPERDQVERKAALLEHGGDFFMAGLLYQSLGQTENAIRMFEQSGDFPRAATLLREHLGDEKSVFDDRYLKLAASAGRAEEIAQLCWDYAGRGSSVERGRFLRRIKQLVDEGYVAGTWFERISPEMAATEELDRVAFSSHAVEWAERAAREVLSEYADVLGIDLGTSNTVVALYHKGLRQPEVVQLENKPLIPSIFGIDDAGVEVVGVSAAAWLGKAPRAVVTEAKRVIGSGKSYKAGGRVYQPEEISARILQCAQQRASEYLRRKIADRMAVLASGDAGSSLSTDWIANHLRDHPPATMFTQAVVTVPAYFNEAQKQATRGAVEIASIKLLRLVHEPTAACLAQRQRKANGEAILVVDLGAGTLDLSLVQMGDGVYEVQEIEGDANLGSADLDKILFAHTQHLVSTSYGRELDRLGQRRLLVACEELKIELSFRNSAAIDLLALVDNKPFHMELTRDEFLVLAQPWIDRIVAVCRKIKSKPDRLLLVGGGTLMPAVRDCIQGAFGLDASTVTDPLTVVARGAAIQAAILVGVEKELLLVDATPFSLGIKAWVRAGEYEFNKLIPRHTAIPIRCSKRYTTIEDNQTVVSIHIYQGESSDPEQNFKIGEFKLEGLIPAKAGVPQIDVTFDINANCLLTVTARDVATGKECGISIEDSHLLTPAQMSTMKERLHKKGQLDEVRQSLSRKAASLAGMLEDRDLATLTQLQSQLRDLVSDFETHFSRYAPSPSDNAVIMDLYRRRDNVSIEVHLLLDKWSSLQRSARSWLEETSQLRLDRDDALEALKKLAAAGENLSQRVEDCVRKGAEFARQYRQWNGVLSGLPVNPTGDPEDVIEYLLRRSRYEEALEVLQRLSRPFNQRQAEVGLEIYARKRDRKGYHDLLTEHTQVLGLEWPNFERLNQCIRAYAASVVLVQCETANGRNSGTGFAIGRREIATNLHVVMASAGHSAAPEQVSVITNGGRRRVSAVHVSSLTKDDVAILRLAEGEPDLRPLRLGFSEITELGERILTIGFPAPRDADYEENLYCNTGLVNRITKTDLCSERVIEVSIELHGGISGAPILNEFGEVVGLLTFSRQWERVIDSGQKTTERSHYAIPVEVLRRLWQAP